MIEALAIYLTVAAALAFTTWARDKRDRVRVMTNLEHAIFGLIWPAVLIVALVMLFFPEED